jgi:hypothetical protein
MVGAGASTSAAQAADALSHGTAAAAVPAPAAAISSSAQDRLQDAAAVVRDVLGTSLPLSQIRQVRRFWQLGHGSALLLLLRSVRCFA